MTLNTLKSNCLTPLRFKGSYNFSFPPILFTGNVLDRQRDCGMPFFGHNDKLPTHFTVAHFKVTYRKVPLCITTFCHIASQSCCRPHTMFLPHAVMIGDDGNVCLSWLIGFGYYRCATLERSCEKIEKHMDHNAP